MDQYCLFHPLQRQQTCIYAGQTKHQFGMRKSRACQTNHTVGWNKFQIVTTNQQYHQCRIVWKLNCYINSAQTPLNHDDGGLLPDNYLQLTDKNKH